jgi:hypothetical protein
VELSVKRTGMEVAITRAEAPATIATFCAGFNAATGLTTARLTAAGRETVRAATER